MDQLRPNAGDSDDGARPPRRVDPADVVLTLVILAGCGFLYWVTTGFERVSDLFAQNVPPEFFPRLLIWTIVVLALALPFEHAFLQRRGRSLAEARAKRIGRTTWLSAAVLLAAVASVPWLGTALAMVAACGALPVLWGERRARVVVPYAIALPLAVTVLFSYLLGVHFEPGVFGIALR